MTVFFPSEAVTRLHGGRGALRPDRKRALEYFLETRPGYEIRITVDGTLLLYHRSGNGGKLWGWSERTFA